MFDNMFDNPSVLKEDLIDDSKPVLGRECISCNRILEWRYFRKDTTDREGHKRQCILCESTPRLSVAENAAKLKEENLNSEAVRRQRFKNQEEYENDAARLGNPLTHSDFLLKLKRLVPDLYVTEGNIVGDLALYRTFPNPDKDKNYEYIGFCPTGWLPEFSLHFFDERNIPVREKRRGWRTLLLRCILCGLVSEEDAHAVFGKAQGEGSAVYNSKLQQYRNRKAK